MCRGFRARHFALMALGPIRSQVERPKRRAFRRCDCEAWLGESFLSFGSLDEVAGRPAQVDAKLWW